MIPELLLHAETRRELEAMLNNPSHAVLLVGDAGMGKGTIARVLAAAYLQQASMSALLGNAYFREILPVSNTIGVEVVRDLRKFMTLKTTGANSLRRVVIIEDAHTMTTEAQNAFLKLLEEPPADTAIIMTADHPQHVLPTVISRLQVVRVLPPEKLAVVDHFSHRGHKSADVERAYLVSGGAVGLISAILDNNDGHPLVSHVQQAKELYGLTMFGRLCQVDTLAKKKEDLPGLLAAFKRISKAAMEQAVTKGQPAAAEKWHERLTAVHTAEKSILRNANAKLVLTNLFLAL